MIYFYLYLPLWQYFPETFQKYLTTQHDYNNQSQQQESVIALCVGHSTKCKKENFFKCSEIISPILLNILPFIDSNGNKKTEMCIWAFQTLGIHSAIISVQQVNMVYFPSQHLKWIKMSNGKYCIFKPKLIIWYFLLKKESTDTNCVSTQKCAYL